MSTKLKIAAAVAAAVLLSACSSPKHEPMPLVNFTPSMEVTEVWSKGLSSAEGFLVPAVYDDMVFAAGGKTLTRLNARTGETEWSVSFDSPITGGVGSDGYVTAVGLWDGNLEVVDAEGKVSWEKKLTTEWLLRLLFLTVWSLPAPWTPVCPHLRLPPANCSGHIRRVSPL